MTPMRTILITLAALAFPLGLGAAVYAAAGPSLASPPAELVSVATDPVAAPATTVDEPEDVSGPCDEAEHRNDPRCAPGATSAEDADDDRGRNRGRSGGADDDHDDDDSRRSGRSGSDDSGRGSDDSGRDSDDSGRGGGNSGRGSDDSGRGGDD